jgi:non-homologous end joining protein Ku
MIDAKLKGEGTVDLMAALKKSLGQAAEDKKPAPTRKKAAAAAKVAPITPPQAAKRKRA